MAHSVGLVLVALHSSLHHGLHGQKICQTIGYYTFEFRNKLAKLFGTFIGFIWLHYLRCTKSAEFIFESMRKNIVYKES